MGDRLHSGAKNPHRENLDAETEANEYLFTKQLSMYYDTNVIERHTYEPLRTAHIYMCVYVCVCVHIYMYMYMYMYICMSVCARCA